MRIAVLIAVASLVLAGCGSGTEEPAAVADANVATGTDAPAAGNAAAPAGRIPVAFQGAWRAAGGACVEGDPLRIDVGPDGILFHESYAGVSRAHEEGNGGLAVSMVVSGEGETWTENAVLVLSEEGRTLTRTLADGRTLGYTRCP